MSGYLIVRNGASITLPELRRELALTQKEVAALFKVTVDTVQAWEHGRKHPNSAAKILLGMLATDPKTTIAFIKTIKIN
jgi:putative transcriptional regulator